MPSPTSTSKFCWEGPAEHVPGVLHAISNGKGVMAVDVPLADLAGWVADTAISGADGNTVFDAIKA